MIYCVGSYGHAIALGRLAIYHLHQPQTVTIPIAIAPQGNRWALSEARGVSNTIPLITSLGAIQAGLETAPSSLSS